MAGIDRREPPGRESLGGRFAPPQPPIESGYKRQFFSAFRFRLSAFGFPLSAFGFFDNKTREAAFVDIVKSGY